MYICIYAYTHVCICVHTYVYYVYIRTYINTYTFPFCYNWCHRWVGWGSMCFAGNIEFKPCEVSLFKLLVHICMGKVRGTQVGLVALVQSSASGGKFLGKIPQSSEWNSPTSMHPGKWTFLLQQCIRVNMLYWHGTKSLTAKVNPRLFVKLVCIRCRLQ